MEQIIEDAKKAGADEWYAINSEHQRVLGPFRTEQECARVAASYASQRWDVVPLACRH